MKTASEIKLPQYDRNKRFDEQQLSCLGNGSLGGKASGLAFVSNILNSNSLLFEDLKFEISIPKMLVLTTSVFDLFMSRNSLYEIAYSDSIDNRITNAFLKADFPFELLGDLRSFIANVKEPLAVRSSSLLEDAMYEPFAGVYATKMIPNNQLDIDTRFQKLIEAIKFVYSSAFFNDAKKYMDSTSHSIKEEKMAVIIQEVVGTRYGKRYYPVISGVARSFNFYPTSKSKPEDGVVNLAFGLGKTIVDGGVCWTYSPAFPKISPPFASVNDMLKNTQTEYWAINMGELPAYNPTKETEYLVKENIHYAENANTLKYVASTFASDSGRLVLGTGRDGPRVLNFAPILELDDFPVNKLLQQLLSVCENELKSPVEIEFAVTFNPNRFGFLQMRPMVVSNEIVEISEEELNNEHVLLASDKVLGNGTLTTIKDIVFVKPNEFNAKHTKAIANEIDSFNKKILEDKLPYVLIGFGRWGSSDPWLGIPVTWNQVSAAKVIVEATLPNMNVDLSQGSHFFHNLTSFNVSYFSIPFTSDFKIDWDWLEEQPTIQESQYVKHIRLNEPLEVKVDGRLSRGIIHKFKSN